jgi:multiple sugar transport system ATP-binding protein
MSGILVEHVTKVFPGGFRAVDDVTLEVEQGEFLVLVGPSGCGKTTLLRMIAGLEDVTHGRISIGDRDVTWLPPGKRDVAMVFQNYALYPHMDVRTNLGYGLRTRGISRAETAARVTNVAELLGLDAMLTRRPRALSGGQRQRVAMGRAIVREPAAFLMDEPLSNLDAKLRVAMRGQLAELHARLGVTTVYVTHDQVEAMTLGARVAVVHEGTIQQIDAPQALYGRPANMFVASFIGSPEMNLIGATVEGDAVSFGGHRLRLAPYRRPRRDGPVMFGLRPEHLQDAAFAEPGHPQLEVTVSVVEELGSESDALFVLDEAAEPPEGRAHGFQEETLIADARPHYMARLDPRTGARAGGRLRLAVDMSHAHFFDVDTGLNVLG